MSVFSDPASGSDTYPATIGGNWTTVTGRQPFARFSNKYQAVYNGFSDFSNAYVNSITPGNDQYMQAVMSNFIGNCSVGPCVRQSTGATTCYALRTDTTVTNVTLDLISAGSITNLATYNITSWVDGDIYKITAVGTTISAYKNGSLLGSVTDSTVASGRIGLVGQGDNVHFVTLEGGDVSTDTLMGMACL